MDFNKWLQYIGSRINELYRIKPHVADYATSISLFDEIKLLEGLRAYLEEKQVEEKYGKKQ